MGAIMGAMRTPVFYFLHLLLADYHQHPTTTSNNNNNNNHIINSSSTSSSNSSSSNSSSSNSSSNSTRLRSPTLCPLKALCLPALAPAAAVLRYSCSPDVQLQSWCTAAVMVYCR
ncbi:hypothetical protein FHG87_022305 [Trinorchestia longiramus]|nr:hypothetical protein FHG87_022305 [Trinorchestia longiramus]